KIGRTLKCGRRRNSWPTLNRQRITHGQRKTDDRRKFVRPRAEEKSNVGDGKLRWKGLRTHWLLEEYWAGK
uniref:Uncharacterized protein n=1 Tax=Cucumis melo TaxID=3656 RepID=A0A9I9EJG2_CUCME